MLIKAIDNGIRPGYDISVQFMDLMRKIVGINGEKILYFEPGTYYFTASLCREEMLYITNTVGDKEFSEGETPHKMNIAVYLNGIKNLTLSCKDVVFVLDGKMTNAAIIDCEKITVDGLEIVCKNPDEHELTVVNKTPFYVDFKLDDESSYKKEAGSFFFLGLDYKTPFYENRNSTYGWFGKIFADDKNHIKRVINPFMGAIHLKEIGDHLFRTFYINTSRFKIGERYCLFNVRRQFSGIFVDRSKDVVLKDVKQRFSYSLALVVQNSENITVDGVDFSPSPEQDKQFASIADFIQICMCRGDVVIKNSNFCGAGDDCLNVHGVHFKIKYINGNKLTVAFMHPQSHGYNPLREGDKIEYVDPKTLLAVGNAEITKSKLINENEIEIEVDSVVNAKKGIVIEDTDACPDLLFADNKLTKIITRGILVTTRGKVVIENNDFDNTEMAAILFSDDAKSWYESGPCRDVEIKNNRFGNCRAYNIQILPENGNTGSVVHGKFVITDNKFESPEKGGIDANGARSVVFIRNEILYPRDNFVKCKNVAERDILL